MYQLSLVRSLLCPEDRLGSYDQDRLVQYLLTDSRRLIFGPTTLFFAIPGKGRSGSDFISGLYDQGCRMFVVDRSAAITHYHDASIIVVDHVVNALQKLASWHRSQYNYPVIGVTGSNGKTIIKEWLAQIAGRSFKVVKSPKSFNSQIGVPLSVWEMSDRHNLAIFEAGVSTVGDMQPLADIIRPDIGIFTNIGTAHDEGFSSRLEKIEEKWKLMASCRVISYPSHYADLDSFIHDCAGPNQVLLRWRYELIKRGSETALPRVKLYIDDISFNFLLPFSDNASIENCLHAVVVLLHLGMSGKAIQEGLRNLKPITMRLEFKEGLNDCYLIDDCYSNDLNGLAQALDFMQRQQAFATSSARTVILSDFLETGLPAKVVYTSAAKLLADKGIMRLIAIGQEISQYLSLFKQDVVAFQTTESFLTSEFADKFNNELILIKGARKFRFEAIVQHLQARVHGTRLEINLDAVAHNFTQYKSLLKPTTKIMVMVKAFAYGSGSYEIANLLQHQGADYLAVAYTDEGVSLRENGITLPIMVMNPGPESFEKLLTYGLEPVVYSLYELQQLLRFLKNVHRFKLDVKPVSVHLEVETGMNRLGFNENKLRLALVELKASSQLLEVKGLFSHLAAADEPTMIDFCLDQVNRFDQMCALVVNELGTQPLRHLLNSPGITRLPEAQYDMVRLGIGLYGYDPNNMIQDRLQPVGRLKSTISQVKTVQAGDTVGYSRRGVVNQTTKTATVAIGYADGFDRRLGNGRYKVKVNGKLVPVIGNVCMDMIMIDLGQVPAKEGDEVIIFDNELTIQALATQLETIPYEILTKVSDRVKRIFYTEQS